MLKNKKNYYYDFDNSHISVENDQYLLTGIEVIKEYKSIVNGLIKTI